MYTINGKFRKLKGHETGGPCTIRGPGNELETCVFSIYAGTQKYYRRARGLLFSLTTPECGKSAFYGPQKDRC